MTSRVSVKVEHLHEDKKICVQSRDKSNGNVIEVGSLEQQGQEVAFHAYEGIEVVVEEIPLNVVQRTSTDTLGVNDG